MALRNADNGSKHIASAKPYANSAAITERLERLFKVRTLLLGCSGLPCDENLALEA
jgi:hypothetical protein